MTLLLEGPGVHPSLSAGFAGKPKESGFIRWDHVSDASIVVAPKLGTCTQGVTTNHSYNSFSQLTNTGYQYDALGRNTVIPALDAPHSSDHKGSIYEIEMNILRENGFRIRKIGPRTWEWTK